jgi:hypothetical protein
MIAFEVYKNGRRQFSAGAADYQTLTSILTLVHPSHPNTTDHALLFSTFGVVPEPTTLAYWPEFDVGVGDRIEIRIVETDTPDAPERTDRHKPHEKAA